MLKGFICPDKEKILCGECLTKCRMEKRCMPYPQLKLISKTRDWTGKISTTQALNGSRYNFLCIVKDYYVSPKKQIFQLIGTNSHSLMEENAEDGAMSEVRFEDDISTGILDYYTPKTGELIDYKFPGTYTVKKTIGLSCVEVFSETEVYKNKTTRNRGKPNEMIHEKGTPKIVKRWYIDPTKKDDFNYAMQCNKYRMFLEELGMKVNKMIVCLTPRDFSTKTALQYGLDDPPYMHEVERIDDSVVKEFYIRKRRELVEAMITKEVPEPCNESEAWGGKKCISHCPVSEWCLNNPNINKQEEEDE